MKCLDLTLPTPAENLACDEALLDWCEAGECDSGILRFWEPRQDFVVVGYANRAAQEVNLEACHAHDIPIFRRCSGGGAVLQGPGCLNHSLILKIDGALQSITDTNGFIMNRHAEALAPLLSEPVSVQGFTDLALGNLKFSGNAQRRKRHWLLFHGSFLLDFDITLMEAILRPPSKEPAWRENRSHANFLTSLKLEAASVKEALRKSWNADEESKEIPHDLIRHLITAKYASADWNLNLRLGNDTVP